MIASAQNRIVVRNRYVATAYAFDRASQKFLLVLNRKFSKWLPPGGHLHKGELPHEGALRELAEETGLTGRILAFSRTPTIDSASCPQLPSPFCILHEDISAMLPATEPISHPYTVRIKHVDFVYAVELHDRIQPTPSLEVKAIEWFLPAEVAALDTYENVVRTCKAVAECAEHLVRVKSP